MTVALRTHTTIWSTTADQSCGHDKPA